MSQRYIKLFFLILLFTFLCRPLVYADKTINVALLPFRINSAENLDYLKRGILDIIASRIAIEGKVVVLEDSQVNEALSQIDDAPLTGEKVKEIGAQLGVDFIISGSLTKIGQSVSIDARMFDLGEEKSVTSLFATSKGMDNLIPKISEFAQKAGAKITGRPYQVTTSPPPAPTASSQASAFMSEFLIPKNKDKAATSSEPGSDFVISGDPLRLKKGFWKSQRLEFEIIGVDVGDVNGDGKNETVVIEDKNISIYKYSNNRLVLIKRIEGKGNHRYLSLDVADINKNGIPEIFVTNLMDSELRSFVIEFKEGIFTQIVTGIKYFLKVNSSTSDDPALLGQKIGTDGLFHGSVRRLVWLDGKYLEDERIPLPSGSIVYGFNMIDLDKDGNKEVVLIDNDDHLRVLSDNGRLQWKSDDIYGGSLNFIVNYPGGQLATDATTDALDVLESRVYIQPRVLSRNHQGESEVVVVKNIPSAGRLLERVRMYRKSEVYNFVWDGLGLSENWKTKTIHGYIADFQIRDIDNDGKDELVVGMIQTSLKSIFKGGKSYVLAYDLMN